MTTNANDPAYATPRVHQVYTDRDSDRVCSEVDQEGSPGMTKREEFAKAAMQGLCANEHFGRRDNTPAAVAALAVTIADELVDALNKSKPAAQPVVDADGVAHKGPDGTLRFPASWIGAQASEDPVQVDWDKVPEGFDWVAMDQDGKRGCYRFQPLDDKDVSMWIMEVPGISGPPAWQELPRGTVIVAPGIDWRFTLRKRPMQASPADERHPSGRLNVGIRWPGRVNEAQP